jgi:hypothetical protein
VPVPADPVAAVLVSAVTVAAILAPAELAPAELAAVQLNATAALVNTTARLTRFEVARTKVRSPVWNTAICQQ